jgi:hypothetical protein
MRMATAPIGRAKGKDGMHLGDAANESVGIVRYGVVRGSLDPPEPAIVECSAS